MMKRPMNNERLFFNMKDRTTCLKGTNMKSHFERVCAVIVTYNRKECLERLINALLSQKYKLTGILIFDNQSSDGTDEFLLEKSYTNSIEECVLHSSITDSTIIYYYRNKENNGGAGGFCEALNLLSDLNYSFYWIMDDDVLPEQDCLGNLIKFQDSYCMITIPNRTGYGYQDYAIEYVDMKKSIVKSIMDWKTCIVPDEITREYIEVQDMPFEGPLINAELISIIGFPNRELFILFDDSEYAMRACKVTQLRYIKEARLFKQIIPTQHNSDAKWKIYYCFRNAVWFNRKYGKTFGARVIRPFVLCFYWGSKYFFRNQIDLLKMLCKGYIDGVNDRLGKIVNPADYKRG